MYQTYRDRGVLFIGLSLEDADSVPAMARCMQSAGITWPNGYGSFETLQSLRADAIPRTWVIGADGRVVWNSASASGLEDGIKKALVAGA